MVMYFALMVDDDGCWLLVAGCWLTIGDGAKNRRNVLEDSPGAAVWSFRRCHKFLFIYRLL
jgi:hypothetical protein